MRPVKENLSTAKRRISRKFLGRAGIHGVGLHPSTADTIVVYREEEDVGEEENKTLIQELRKEASPFKIEIVDTEAPTIRKSVPSKNAAAKSPDSNDMLKDKD